MISLDGGGGVEAKGTPPPLPKPLSGGIAGDNYFTTTLAQDYGTRTGKDSTDGPRLT